MQLLEKTAFRFLGHRDIPPTHAPASTTISTFTAKSASSKLFLHKPIADDLFHCGCLLGGIHSGVKHSRPRHLPLSTPSRSTSATATFTRNAFKAAPVTASKICSRSNRARALVVNSGCTNAVTGQQGLADAWAMARATDSLLAPAFSPFPSSSPQSFVRTVRSHIRSGTALQHGRRQHAFMTTDTYPKLRAWTLPLGNGIDK